MIGKTGKGKGKVFASALVADPAADGWDAPPVTAAAAAAAGTPGTSASASRFPDEPSAIAIMVRQMATRYGMWLMVFKVLRHT